MITDFEQMNSQFYGSKTILKLYYIVYIFLKNVINSEHTCFRKPKNWPKNKVKHFKNYFHFLHFNIIANY